VTSATADFVAPAVEDVASAADNVTFAADDVVPVERRG
jgi:hypothetical protein